MAAERIGILGNPAARGVGAGLERVRAALEQRRHPAIEIHGESVGETVDRLGEALAGGLDRLVIVGGDGSVHLAAQALAGTDTVLGIVPAGTGNDTARALGLLDVEDPVSAALGPGRSMDAVRAEGHWVVSVATLGFGGDVTDRANRTTWVGGEIQYSVATMLELPRLRTVPLTLTLDEEVCELDSVMLAVANTSHFGGGMAICPGARPDDGVLDIAALADVGRAAVLSLFLKVFRGTHVDDSRVRTWRARSVRLETRDGWACDLWGDGERICPLPVTLEVVPAALQVAGWAP